MKPNDKHFEQRWRVIVTAIIATFLLAEPAFAQSLEPLENIADFFVRFLTGNFATSLAVIAVVGLGLLGLGGHLRWTIAGSIILSIALIFGAVNIVAALRGSI